MIALVRELLKDEDGAALIEYTVILSLMLGATIVLMSLVGSWVSGRWAALLVTLDAR